MLYGQLLNKLMLLPSLKKEEEGFLQLVSPSSHFFTNLFFPEKILKITLAYYKNNHSERHGS